MIKTQSPPPSTQTSMLLEAKTGLTAQQWILLTFSFLLGIATVFTVDKVFLSPSASSGAVQAAVAHP